MPPEKQRGILKFLQSQHDFPLTVSTGDKKPFFGLSRWKNSKGLKFIPADDEGFALRGDKKRLLYKGRKRSHRFTILNDGAFEYDCILLREPESNVITLRMEGAENFDFFRQPDFVTDPFLKGSYAVYKKETLVGEGTGKLCHIHRPLVIDALGRRCWGELSVVGNELRITVPEKWLSEAKYPVTVDPTVGTTTVGSQTYDPETDDELCCEIMIPVNRFLAVVGIAGSCTAYFYSNRKNDGGRAVFYSDHGNTPLYKLSSNENFINMYSGVGWCLGTVNCTGVASGQYVWFGLCAEYVWYPRFDYGSKCYKNSWEDETSIPYTYPLWNANEYYNFKLSMYFSFTSGANYTRSITHGVSLADTGKLSIDYKRQAVQQVHIITPLHVFFTYLRTCVTNACNYVNFSGFPIKTRNISENIRINTDLGNKRDIKRKFDETLINTDNAARSQGFIKKIYENIFNADSFNYTVLFIRVVNETQTITDLIQKTRIYIRLLYDEARNIEEIQRQGNYYRTESEIVKAGGSAFRHLLIFIKIFTNTFARDLLFRHFLIAREELVLKSKIKREITLESSIC